MRHLATEQPCELPETNTVTLHFNYIHNPSPRDGYARPQLPIKPTTKSSPCEIQYSEPFFFSLSLSLNSLINHNTYINSTVLDFPQNKAQECLRRPLPGGTTALSPPFSLLRSRISFSCFFLAYYECVCVCGFPIPTPSPTTEH